jgi:hypothetical protein
MDAGRLGKGRCSRGLLVPFVEPMVTHFCFDPLMSVASTLLSVETLENGFLSIHVNQERWMKMKLQPYNSPDGSLFGILK